MINENYILKFGKYKNSGSLRFCDLLRIIHPKPINEIQQELFNKIMAESDPTRTETLAIPYTWETWAAAFVLSSPFTAGSFRRRG